MADARRYLAFDLGASSGRAICGTFADGRMTLEELHRFPNGPVQVGGTLYWDALGLFRECKAGLSAYSAKYGREVAGIGSDSWGVDFGLLDKDGALLGNPVHYRDSRTDGMPELLFKTVSRKQVFKQTGIQTMPINTLYQLYSMVQNRSPILDKAETLLCMADLMNYFFTGETIQEFSLATTTQMYNPVESDWARSMLDEVGIPTGMLPDVVAPGSVVGTLFDHIAQECGVAPAPVLAPASHDTAAAVAAVPAAGEGWLYLSSGTWSLLGAELTEPRITDRVAQLNFTNEGGVDGTYRFLKNITGLWLVQECQRIWEQEGKAYSFAELAQMAGDAAPFKAVIDPNDPSFATPGDMPARIAAFCEKTGQAAPATEGEVIRVCLEGLALAYRSLLESISDATGKSYGTMHIVGGGTQNTLLNQMAADATGMQVKTGPVEATAFGNCLMQAIALGDIGSLAEAREIVRASVEIEEYAPAADRGAWEDAYGTFKTICG